MHRNELKSAARVIDVVKNANRKNVVVSLASALETKRMESI